MVWCPDWPVVAAAAQAGLDAGPPVAVIAANRVVACSATARADGVRRGMRRREAQSRCPELTVFDDDPVRDARLFEPVAAAVEELAVGVEVIRPGLVAVPARGPAGYFGGVERAAERLVDQVAVRTGVECQVGVADGVFAATLAARRGVVVPTGGNAEFLAPLSVRELHRPGEGVDRGELVDLLRRLGLRSLGAFAQLSPHDVSSRFGADALLAHRLAGGIEERPAVRRRPPADLSVSQVLDPPVDRVEAVAFVARGLAERLTAGLAAHGLGCTRLGITASTAAGEELHRVWRCAEPLTTRGITDRVRWQLDGWLRQRGRPTGPVSVLRLEPDELVAGQFLQHSLWRGGQAEDERAGRALVHVQGLLGPRAVVVPVLGGGRGPADRVRLVPWGDERSPPAGADAPWPGRLPAPSPSTVLPGLSGPPVPARVLDAEGADVRISDRFVLSGGPARVVVAGGWPRAVRGWAGPWPAEEHWWDGAARQRARLQVLLDADDSEVDGETALLLVRENDNWTVEGMYD